MTTRKGSYQAIPHQSLDWSDLGVTVDAISGFGNAAWIQNNSQYGTYPRGNYTFSTDSNTYEDAGSSTYADDTFRQGSNYKSIEEAKAAYQNGTLTTPVFLVQQGAGRLPLIYRINGFQQPTQQGPVVEETPVETVQNPPTVTSKPATVRTSKPSTKGTYVPTEYQQGLAKISGGHTYYTFDGYSNEDIAAAIDQVMRRGTKDNNYYIEDPSDPINESVTTEVPETQTSTSSQTQMDSQAPTTKRSLLGRAKDWLFGRTDDTSGYTTRETSSNYVTLQGYTYPHRNVDLWSVDPEVAAQVREILTQTTTPKTAKNDVVWTSVPLQNLPNGELNDSTFHVVYKDANGWLTDNWTWKPTTQSIPYHVNNQDVLYTDIFIPDGQKLNVHRGSHLRRVYGMTPEQKRQYQRENAAEIQQFEANRQKGFQYDVDAEYPYLQSTTPYYNSVVKVEDALANPEQYHLQVKSAGGTLNYLKYFNNAISNKF